MQASQFQRKIPAGKLLFSEGDTSRETYILIEGEAEVLKGDQLIATISKGGSFIGEMATLLGEPRTATVRTTRESTFIVVGNDNIEALVAKIPSMGIKLARTLAVRLALTTRELTQIKEQMSQGLVAAANTEAQPAMHHIVMDELEAHISGSDRRKLLKKMMKKRMSSSGNMSEAKEAFKSFREKIKLYEDSEDPLMSLAEEFGLAEDYENELLKTYGSPSSVGDSNSGSGAELTTSGGDGDTSSENMSFDSSPSYATSVRATIGPDSGPGADISIGIATGNSLAESGDYEGAAAEYHKVLETEPENVHVRLNLGRVLRKAGNLDGAVQQFEHALELDSSDAKVFNELAKCRYDRSDIEGAIESAHNALALNPDYVEALNNLGIFNYKKGDREEARKAWAHVLQVEPDNAKANKLIKKVS